MKKYKTTHGSQIEKVEILRETDQSVFIDRWGKEARRSKRGEYCNYFDTFDEAKQYLMQESQGKIENLHIQLGYETKELAKIVKMEE